MECNLSASRKVKIMCPEYTDTLLIIMSRGQLALFYP